MWYRAPCPPVLPGPMLTAVEGVAVGHWTDPDARAGCTVVFFAGGAVASGEVRGGAPATREFELLRPECLVQRIDAVVLSGRSAFGLAAADGVMAFCEEHGQGFDTPGGVVPIVVGMSVFDLTVGDPAIRPGYDEGYAAAAAAAGGVVELGAVGAGVAATTGKWTGSSRPGPGGLVGHAIHHGELVVASLVVLNAFGDIDDGSQLSDRLPEPGSVFHDAPMGTNTTIGVVATNAALDKTGCLLVAQGAHDGLARSTAPAHTRVDGDAFVAVATGEVRASPDEVRFLAVAAVEKAIRSLI